MIFALLAHQDEHVLAAQLDNIRHYNPDARIVLYNGGTDPYFARGFNIPICPYSRPMKHGNLTRYLWDIMKWLEETCVDYEYLINLDHDVLFLKHGFQAFLDETMQEYDCMGWDMVTSCSRRDSDLSCVQTMWDEWHIWKPVFQTDLFIRFLNPAQVYRHQLVRRMLASVDHEEMEGMFAASRVFALEEMFFVTLALACGGRIREYPRDNTWQRVARFQRPGISREEAYRAIHRPYYFWIHPVKGMELIRMHQWLMSGASRQEMPSSPAELSAAENRRLAERGRSRNDRKRKRISKPAAKNKRNAAVKERKAYMKRMVLSGRRKGRHPLLDEKIKAAGSIGRRSWGKGRPAKKQ